MLNKKMTFDEIKSNKDLFLETYNIAKEFEKSGYKWEDLMMIGYDYEQRYDSFFSTIQKFIAEISKFKDVHSYRYRIKSTDSLLVKIIKKYSGVTKDNYIEKITDLLGIRILYIFKSDYFSIHKQIMQNYGNQKTENIHLKLKEGDDESTYKDMLEKEDVKIEKNNAYRSIHYTFFSSTKNINNSPKIEIQTRTIFEEGWSEIDHKLVYKQDKESHLQFVSHILSDMVGTCDALGSLMQYLSKSQDNSVPKEGEIGEIIKRFLHK